MARAATEPRMGIERASSLERTLDFGELGRYPLPCFRSAFGFSAPQREQIPSIQFCRLVHAGVLDCLAEGLASPRDCFPVAGLSGSDTRGASLSALN